MRTLFLFAVVLVIPLQAQDAQPPKPTEAKPDTKTDAKPDTKQEAASPVPSEESWLTGSIDVGYRWRTDVGGSLNTYRTFVNLGSGPKLMGADFTVTDPGHHLFDQVHVRAYSWGDEPYETFHLDAKKSKLYDFTADYRDFAYFNFLPSFADPLLARGLVLSEQSFDERRRFGSFQLDLLPSSHFRPYLAYNRDSNSGTGATAFVTDSNEFPVPNTLRDLTNLYRGGVRMEFRRFHVTLEEGGTTFKDDQSVYQNPGSTNYGNVAAPLFGQTLDLKSLLAAYGIRGTSNYTKALFTASATSWLDVYGQFLYSEPNTTVHYQQTDAGNLFLQSQFLFYNSQQYLLSSAAKLPHTTVSLGAEIRPMRRVRIVESWLTDRLHNAGSALSTQTFTTPPTSVQMAAFLTSSLVNNYSQEQVDAFYDATSKLMLRGGYRYVWGDANDATLPVAGLVSSDHATLRRNVGLGGFRFRALRNLSITGEAEAGSSSGSYFRTSLYNYQKVRAQVRYQASNSLSFSADVTVLDNQNPVPGVNYDYTSRQETVSLFWSPSGGKRFDFEGSYTRSTLRSDIGYLSPQDLLPLVFLYRDDAHIGTALFTFKLPQQGLFAPKLTAGGSFVVSSGSRATSYYQPLATLWLPLGKHVNWFTEWRYYGYGEALYFYEGFRTHLVTTGLRYSR